MVQVTSSCEFCLQCCQIGRYPECLAEANNKWKELLTPGKKVVQYLFDGKQYLVVNIINNENTEYEFDKN